MRSIIGTNGQVAGDCLTQILVKHRVLKIETMSGEHRIPTGSRRVVDQVRLKRTTVATLPGCEVDISCLRNQAKASFACTTPWHERKKVGPP